MKSFSFLVLFLVLSALTRATELTDLGQGLSYLRIHSVAGSEAALRKAVPGAGALVLDLRYATADETSAAILKSVLSSRPVHAQLYLLVSPATPPALGPVIIAAPAVTLGAPDSIPAARVKVQTDAAADRRAYDALDAGTELSKLITGKIEKERFDEASLVQEFKNGNTTTELPRPSDPTAPAAPTPANEPPAGAAASATEKPLPVPTDRVLQRAVHLHRALLALKSR